MPELIHIHSLFSTGVSIHRCSEHSCHPCPRGFFWLYQGTLPLQRVGLPAATEAINLQLWWQPWAGPGQEVHWEAGDSVLHPGDLTCDVHVFQKSWGTEALVSGLPLGLGCWLFCFWFREQCPGPPAGPPCTVVQVGDTWSLRVPCIWRISSEHSCLPAIFMLAYLLIVCLTNSPEPRDCWGLHQLHAQHPAEAGPSTLPPVTAWTTRVVWILQ